MAHLFGRLRCAAKDTDLANWLIKMLCLLQGEKVRRWNREQAKVVFS